jgi:hypothetical protein
MHHQHKHPTTPNLRHRFICGATAALIAQGCGHDLAQATDEQIEYVRSTVNHGNEHFLPVLSELAEASSEDLVFGFNGEGGKEEFIRDLTLSSENASRVIESGRVYTFTDPEYIGSAFYRNMGSNHDLIAVNEANLVIMPLDDTIDGHCTESGTCPFTWSDIIHEGSHEFVVHSSAVDEYVENRGPKSGYDNLLLNQERDFSYLLSYSADEIQSFFSFNVLESVELERVWLEGVLFNKEIDPHGFELNRQFYSDKLSDLSTPEGWAKQTVDDYNLEFFSEFWGVPLEEKQRIIAESGWYEEYIEDEMKEFVSEARRELGLEYDETRVELDREISTEWNLNDEGRREGSDIKFG